MNTITKTVLLSMTLCFVALSSMAQMQSSRKYRVIAYKNGEPQTFSVSNEVEVIPPMTLYDPNTFTPNGDGLNDTFGIAGEAVKDFKMEVFNRWGQLIFQSSNPNLRWDGTFQGTQVAEGVYVYKLTAQGNKGKRETKEGSVNVVM